MVKRIFSMILASMLLIGTLTVVSASTTKNYADDFESADQGVITVTASAGYTSDVWKMTANQAFNACNGGGAFFDANNKPNAELEVTKLDGNSVMKFTSKKAGNVGVSTTARSFSSNSCDTIFISFDFMIPDNGAKGDFYISSRTTSSSTYVNLILVRGNGNYMYEVKKDGNLDGDSEDSFTFTRGAWYKAVLKATTASSHIIIYDANGVKKLDNENQEIAGPSSSAQLSLTTPGAANYTMYLDNSEIVIVNSTSNTVGIDFERTTNNEVVSASTKSVDVTFDQPVDPNSVVTLTGGLAPITCTATAVGAETLRISWDATLLPETEYTLDCSAVKGWAGNKGAADTKITFTTGEAEKDVYAVNAGTVIPAGGTVSGPVNVWIKNYGATAITPDIMVALYKSNGKELVGVEKFENQTINGDVSLNLEGSYSDVTSIKVIVLNDLSTLQPIAENITIK